MDVRCGAEDRRCYWAYSTCRIAAMICCCCSGSCNNIKYCLNELKIVIYAALGLLTLVMAVTVNVVVAGALEHEHAAISEGFQY
jgi:hypothetical protein